MKWCLRARDVSSEMPAIFLLIDNHEERIVSLVGTGCEEEGIPVVWDYISGTQAHPAHEASMRSRLDTGIAICGRTASIGISHLPDRAWIEMEIDDDRLWRWLGQAAARIVKCQPMPPLPSAEQSVPEPKAADVQPKESALPAGDVALIEFEAPFTEQNRAQSESRKPSSEEGGETEEQKLRKIIELIIQGER